MGNTKDLIFCNYVIYKNMQWFWSINFNALFSRNMESGEVKKWGEFVICNGVAYHYVVLYHNKIIAVPGVERRILIFDIETKAFRYVNVKIRFPEDNRNAFFSYVVSGKLLFVIGNEIPYIIKFDMESENIEEILDLGAYISDRTLYFREAVLDKNQLVLPLVEENLIFEIDIAAMKWTSRKAGGGKGGFSAVCKDKNSIWLMPAQKGAILQWCQESDEMISYDIEKMGFQYMSMTDNFHSGIFSGNKIWFFPFYGNIVLSFDLEKREMSKENAINRYLNEVMSESGEGKFQAVQVEQGQFFLLSCYTGKAVPLMYDSAEDEVKVLDWKFELPYEEYFDYLDIRGIKVKNETDIPLENFVNYVADNNIEKADEYSWADIQYGYQIWNTISGNNDK